METECYLMITQIGQMSFVVGYGLPSAITRFIPTVEPSPAASGSSVWLPLSKHAGGAQGSGGWNSVQAA